MKLATLATCNLAQWALDFDGNLRRIRESICLAKEKGARYRIGPELEVCGYGCEDHFLEGDTYLHCWQVIASLLSDPELTNEIVCDIGMPIVHRNVRYNCRIYLLNRKIWFIRPKMALADDGNYREGRWFTSWTRRFELQQYYLPITVSSITGQTTVPFGDGCIAFHDTVIGAESCEELFTPNSPHIQLSLDGVEIIGNASGSHHELRKLHKRVDLMRNATSKCGGVYLYSNHQSCDGGRLYYDGSAMIVVNGEVVAQGSQFSLREIEVVTATVDISAIRTYRARMVSRAMQASITPSVPRVDIPFRLLSSDILLIPNPPISVRYHRVEEEIAFGPACWLWDYLRRSGMNGYFLPLSGGADSSSTAAIVSIMTKLVMREIRNGNTRVLHDVRRIADYSESEIPTSPEELAGRIFFTAYLGSVNSTGETRERAASLAAAIGATHTEVAIDGITTALVGAVVPSLQYEPKFRAYGGTSTDNLALQNIQARSRMVLSYMLAQLTLQSKGRSGSLLVLGSGNVDEALRGYLTKYDCSSADVNPIGGISKVDLKKFLLWASDDSFVNLPILKAVALATPTAELEPTTENYQQSDEVDMGMTYEELSIFGKLRKVECSGPYSMYLKLLTIWQHLTADEIAIKVKRFFRYYSINRHKSTVLPPAYHAENYSPDDNRFDLRPFLYNSSWTWQFNEIDKHVKAYTEARRNSCVK